MDEVVRRGRGQGLDVGDEDDVALKANSLMVHDVGEDRLHDDNPVGGIGHESHRGSRIGVKKNLLEEVEARLGTLLPFR